MDSSQDSDLAPFFFGELSQSEHFFEIKQPLNCSNWYLSFPICTIRLKVNVFRKPILLTMKSKPLWFKYCDSTAKFIFGHRVYKVFGRNEKNFAFDK